MSEIKMKKCTKCGNEYPATSEYFYKRSNGDKLENQCKKCKCKQYHIMRFGNIIPYYEIDQEISNEEMIKLYKLILSNKINKFPENPKYTKDNAISLFKYLISDLLCWDKETLIKKFTFNSVIKKYKLYALTRKFFDSYIEPIILAFPEWNLKIWEFHEAPDNFYTKDYNKKEVIEWIINKMKEDKIINNIYEIPKKINRNILKQYRIIKILKYFDNSVINMCQWYFYNYTYYTPKVWNYNSAPNGIWNKDTIKFCIRKFLFDKGFDGESISWLKNNVTREFLLKNGLYTPLEYYHYNIFNLLNNCFPELNLNAENFKMIIKDNFIFNSIEELKVYSYLKNNFNINIIPIGKQRLRYKFYNEISDEYYIPDFIITKINNIKINKPIIIEYFGLFKEKGIPLVENYNQKTLRKINFFSNKNDILFFYLFPKEINNLESLNQKFSDFLILNNLN